MKKKISIIDIARELNVAKSTVSFIINGKAKEKRISDKLAKRITDHIEQRGFKPNELARSLSTGKTKMLCLMVEKISDYFFSHLAFMLEELAYRHDYKIIYCSTENDADRAKDLINAMRGRHVDGYIIVPPAGIEMEIQDLIDDEIPLVLFDRYLPSIDSDYLVLDNHKSTFDALSFLVESNHSNIAFITLDSEQIQMTDRLKGYNDACEKFNLLPFLLKIPFNNSKEETTKQISKFLRKNKNLDGIIFGTNYIAISGISALNGLQIKFPEDLSIIAFDEHDLFNVYNPSITTIVQPVQQMAEKLFKTLLSRLNKKPIGKKSQTVVPAVLKIGGSCRERNNQ